jgi:hypothetical protein
MFDTRLLSNEQASQMNGVAKTGQRKTKAASLLGVRGEDNVIPQKTKGDMGEETGAATTATTTTTISRIITDRAESSEDRGRLAAVIGERDGQISATQKSRR